MRSLLKIRPNALTFIIFFPFMTACSQQITCTLEGCPSSGLVTLSSDFQNGQADAVVNDNSGLESKINSILTRLGLIDALNQLFEKAMTLHDERITALETQSSDDAATRQTIQNRIDDYESQLISLGAEIISLEQSLNDNIDTLGEQLALEIATLKGQYDTIQAALDSLDTRFESFKEQQAEINLTVSSAISGLTSQISQVRSDLQDQINENAENIETIQESIVALESAIGRIQKSIRNIRKRVKALEAELSETIGRVEELQGELTDLIADFLEEMTKISNFINGVEALINASGSCSIGSQVDVMKNTSGNGNSEVVDYSYRVIQCGENSYQILVP